MAGAGNANSEWRWMPIGGLRNLRDLGGYRTEGGDTVRRARIYRSDSLHLLEASEISAFDNLGIGTIIDLRRSEELIEAPGPLPSINVELKSRRVADTPREALQTTADGERWLFEDYCGMIDHAAPVTLAILRAVMSTDRPVLFHCLAGKDRTGLISALVLGALGVPREAVLDDYELTGVYGGAAHVPHVVELFVSMGFGHDGVTAILNVSRRAMADALNLIDARYGDIRSYLEHGDEAAADTIKQAVLHLVGD